MGWRTVKADDFNRTEPAGPPVGYAGAAAWTTTGTRLRLTNVTGVSQLVAAAPSPPLTQDGQRISSVQYGGANVGVMLRRVDANNYYGMRRTSSSAQAFTVITGTTTLVGSPMPCTIGDRISLEATETTEGTSLAAWVNDGARDTVLLTGSRRLYGRGYGYRANTSGGGTAEFAGLLVEEFVPDTLGWWDGTTEVPAEYLGWWDGAVLVPSTFEGSAG